MKIPSINKNISVLLLYLVITSYFWQKCNAQKVFRWDLDGDYEALKNYEAMKNVDSDSPPERTLCSGSFGEDCEDERDNLIYNMQLWKRQPPHAVVASIGDKTIRSGPVFQNGQTRRCSCEQEPGSIDLGLLYYPRHVPSLVCKQGGCHGGHKCYPKQYKVRVLKHKQPEDETSESNTAGIPEMLKEMFVPKTIPVVVACECGP